MLDELLEANAHYAAGFPFAGVPGRAASGVGLVTCMDTRIDPLAILGLRVGDAKIVRNAGARVTADALRSLLLAANFLGVEEIAVMHHTQCALAGSTDEEIVSGLAEPERSVLATWELMAMPDPDAALAADVKAVRECKGMPERVRVEGWRYDVDTGLVSRVVAHSA